MADLGAPLAALVVNRMQPWPVSASPAQVLERCQGEPFAADLQSLADALGTDSSVPAGAQPQAEIASAVLSYARKCRSELSRCTRLATAARDRDLGFARVAELAEPLDHLEGLLEIAVQLTAEPLPVPSC
jgi:hypothetical protein